MHSTRKSRPLNLRPITTEVREVYVDLDAADFRHLADDFDSVIVRVTGLDSPSGRPTSRSLRIPASLLREPRAVAVDHDPFA